MPVTVPRAQCDFFKCLVFPTNGQRKFHYLHWYKTKKKKKKAAHIHTMFWCFVKVLYNPTPHGHLMAWHLNQIQFISFHTNKKVHRYPVKIRICWYSMWAVQLSSVCNSSSRFWELLKVVMSSKVNVKPTLTLICYIFYLIMYFIVSAFKCFIACYILYSNSSFLFIMNLKSFYCLYVYCLIISLSFLCKALWIALTYKTDAIQKVRIKVDCCSEMIFC